MLKQLFKLKQNNTTIQREIIAGLTTFMTMSYILIVNPEILAAAGMNQASVFTATALASVIATLVMAFYARLPFALAPGMGLNAFFAFTVVNQMGYSWQFALTAVFLEGIVFIVLTLLKIRQTIIKSIPENIKKAVSVGIGLFIAFIGLKNAGIIVDSDSTLLQLGDITGGSALVALLGLIITVCLLVFRIKGALLLGIVITALIGIPFDVTPIPQNLAFWSLPPSVEPVFWKFQWQNVFTLDMLIVLFTFLFVDLFDTIGTLVGVATKAGMIRRDGSLPRAKQALFADAVGTTVGAMLGTSTVTTYIESASGIAEGGKTGFTSLTVAVLFGLSLFFSPLFLMIPSIATAPVLIIVGLFMITPISGIDFSDYTEALPAFLTIIMMPLTNNISEGIIFGVLSYVVLKTIAGKWKHVSAAIYIIAILFIIKLIL